MSKLSFWSLRFGHFCHFSRKLKSFASVSMWFHFYCHFDTKAKLAQISKKTSLFCPFFSLVKGILVILSTYPTPPTLSFSFLFSLLIYTTKPPSSPSHLHSVTCSDAAATTQGYQ
ncbi:hypothetical protein Hanom_Chr16g01468051 [Helianthus anomalus]